MSFTADVNKWARTVARDNPKKVRDGVLLKLFSAVIKDTPVDKGPLRGGWVTSSGTRTNALGSADKTGNDAINLVSRVVRFAPMSESIFFQNNLPYAEVVEFGTYSGVGPKTVDRLGGVFSRQAPQGMMRKNVIRFEILMAREVEKVNR